MTTASAEFGHNNATTNERVDAYDAMTADRPYRGVAGFLAGPSGKARVQARVVTGATRPRRGRP